MRKGKLPVIFGGWLSCDSVEARQHERCTPGLIWRLAQTPGFCLSRLISRDAGTRAIVRNRFRTELAGYRAIRALKNHDSSILTAWHFRQQQRRGIHPVPETIITGPGDGYITIGGWSNVGFEHMLDIERRRLL